MSAISDYRKSSFSYSPSYRTVVVKATLPEALKLVIEGKISGDTIYSQAPSGLQEILDEACMQGFGKKFTNLGIAEQREVCAMFLMVLQAIEEKVNIAGSPKAMGKAYRPKRWWQFWR